MEISSVKFKKNREIIQSVGGYVVLIHCLIFYFLPALAQYIFFDEIYSIYQRVPVYIEALLFIAISLIIFWFTYLRVRKIRLFIVSQTLGKLSARFVYLYIRYRPALMIFYIVFVGYIYILGLDFRNVRYRSYGMSDAGSLLYLFVLI